MIDFKVVRNFNKEENRWEYMFTNGSRYIASYYKDYGLDKEEMLINWFNQCLKALDDEIKTPKE